MATNYKGVDYMDNYTLDGEIWKDVLGYEGCYQISSLGRVKSLKRKYVKEDKIISGSLTSDGYRQVQFRKNGKTETRLLNSLLKEYFHPKCDIKTNVSCAVCDKPLHRKPSDFKKNITGFFFCSADCDAKLRSEKMLDRSLNDIQKRIGTNDFKGWLFEKYIIEKKSTQEISMEIFGFKRYDTSICDWLRRFDIPARAGVGKGKKHWKYNFNKTDEERILNRRYPEYIKWRKSVFERDDYTCFTCGQVGGILNAHHLDGYDKFIKLRTELSNGVTLCELCHDEFHNQYGRGNNTRKQFEEYTKIKASNK